MTIDGPQHISIRGAREHNLKDIDLDIPRGELVVVCGVSGSGKSSLAFDCVYAEGQRRYVESLSAYARQFLGQLRKPDVDSIEGLSPAVAIDQKSTSSNPRSTVGTVTEIHDHLRLLWARVGTAHCQDDGTPLGSSDIESIIRRVAHRDGARVLIGATVVKARKGTMKSEVEALVRAGFVRGRLDGRDLEFAEFELAEKNLRHDLEVIVDRVVVKPSSLQRLRESVETALRAGEGSAFVEVLGADGEVERELCSLTGACRTCGKSWPELEPRSFSFNSPFGACQACEGIGLQYSGSEDLIVPDGTRSLNEGALAPWQGWYGGYHRWVLDAVCETLGIDMDAPWNALSRKERSVIIEGYPGELVAYFQQKRYNVKFEGVAPWLARRLAEAKTDRQREQAESFMREVPCRACAGQRLSPYSLGVTVAGASIAQVSAMTVTEAHEWFENLTLTAEQEAIVGRLVKEITDRLGFLRDVGLEYVTLDRSARTLSGGEAQRIRLASQVGAGLAGVLYVLDEPSIGLHPQDNQRLIRTLVKLRDLGNTVLVVEHDEETIDAANWVIEIGPRAGEHGGEVVFSGTPQELLEADTLTGAYLSRRAEIPTPRERVQRSGEIVITNAAENNLRGIDVTIPLGCFTAIAGVSGSGKSTLISEILQPALSRQLHGARVMPGRHGSIKGVELIDKCINIDQSPIGRTPRSNPATYTGVFDKIRSLFGDLPEAKARGWKPGRFSFNVPVANGGGRCEACQGEGTKTIEMNFLPDVHVPCAECDGRRFSQATLEVQFKNASIADVLEMTVDTALEHFTAQPSIKRPLQVLADVGLGYVRLGQAATQLSGGEAQRVKLAAELQRRSTGRTLYLLDEPTTGLHFDDVAKLVGVLQRLVEGGNSIVVIEHNVDVLRAADWIVELGPKGGKDGGMLVAEGTPEHVATLETPTAAFIAQALSAHPPAARDGVTATASGAAEKKPAAKKAAEKKPAEKKTAGKKKTAAKKSAAKTSATKESASEKAPAKSGVKRGVKR